MGRNWPYSITIQRAGDTTTETGEIKHETSRTCFGASIRAPALRNGELGPGCDVLGTEPPTDGVSALLVFQLGQWRGDSAGSNKAGP